MANRRLDITARQIAAICKGAKKEGYAPIVQIGNALVRLVPEDRVIPDKAKPEVDEYKDFRL